MGLKEIIIQKIKEEGPIPFEQFMEMCLYFPELGYYTSSRNKIGKSGDFYTSACLTPVFGAMIGRKLEEMWEKLNRKAFTIIEYGAGTGMLCRDILTYLKNNEKFYEQLSYCIIEKSPVMRAIERTHLSEKVKWFDSIKEIPDVNGCILSNELVDNFAVHQVVMGAELMEVFVAYENGFSELLQPASAELKEYLKALKIELPNGFRAEINLQAIHWISDIAAALKQGYLMTIDYGFLSSELYQPYRSEGTLVCYNNHTINDCLYEHIGEQDITAHVNFSALIDYGTKQGLKVMEYKDQCQFLLSMGFNQFLQQVFSQEKDIKKAARTVAVISHTLLYEMGNKFKFLIQEKGIS